MVSASVLRFSRFVLASFLISCTVICKAHISALAFALPLALPLHRGCLSHSPADKEKSERVQPVLPCVFVQ